MGHARNYLTQDIVRRILRDYFAYDVNFVQNVTDLDDKVRGSLYGRVERCRLIRRLRSGSL